MLLAMGDSSYSALFVAAVILAFVRPRIMIVVLATTSNETTPTVRLFRRLGLYITADDVLRTKFVLHSQTGRSVREGKGAEGQISF